MSIIGKIAKEIGEEVAEGLTKKAAPKVMPAVKKPLEWGFKGRKPTDINYEKNYYENKRQEISINNENKIKRGSRRNKFIAQLRDKYEEDGDYVTRTYWDTNRAFKELEDLGVPRELTGKVVGNNLGVSYLNRLAKKGTPAKSYTQKKQDWETGWLRYYNELTKSQKETFDSLSDEWNGTVNDLVDAAKSL